MPFWLSNLGTSLSARLKLWSVACSSLSACRGPLSLLNAPSGSGGRCADSGAPSPGTTLLEGPGRRGRHPI